MKLPKHFGPQGFQKTLSSMQGAMARAQALEDELAAERLTVEKNGVTAIFSGKGELVKITLEPALVDPEDVETLEDVITAVMRDGFTKATELRDQKVKEILPNVPEIPGLTG